MTKRILIVSGDFVLTGGMDRANYALADFLAKSGVQVELVAHRVAPELLAYPNLIHHKVYKPANSYLLGSHLLAREGKLRATSVLRSGGRVITNGGNCVFNDVTWIHYLHAAYRPGIRSPLRKIKQWIERPIALASEKHSLNKARLVIANSESTKNAISKFYGVGQTKVHTVYYGIDKSKFYPAKESERIMLRAQLGWDVAPRIVFIGALGDRRKGFDVLGKAWTKLIQDEAWNARLVVVGDGAEQRKWKTEWSNSTRKESVEFLGFRKDVPNVLRAADCLVSPTRYEAYGLGVHEAICCGLPAIVSHSAGVAERFPTGLEFLLLNDPENEDELVSKLRQWFQNCAQYSTLIRPFQMTLENKSWDGMAEEITQLVT